MAERSPSACTTIHVTRTSPSCPPRDVDVNSSFRLVRRFAGDDVFAQGQSLFSHRALRHWAKRRSTDTSPRRRSTNWTRFRAKDDAAVGDARNGLRLARGWRRLDWRRLDWRRLRRDRLGFPRGTLPGAKPSSLSFWRLAWF